METQPVMWSLFSPNSSVLPDSEVFWRWSAVLLRWRSNTFNADPIPHTERKDCCRAQNTTETRPAFRQKITAHGCGTLSCWTQLSTTGCKTQRIHSQPWLPNAGRRPFKNGHVHVWRARARGSVNTPPTNGSVCSGWLPLMSLTQWCRLTACHYCHMFSSMLAPHCSPSQWCGAPSCTLVYIIQ